MGSGEATDKLVFLGVVEACATSQVKMGDRLLKKDQEARSWQEHKKAG